MNAVVWAILLTRAASAQVQTKVQIDVIEFGYGGSFRSGEWVGMRVALTSALDEVRNAVVQWEFPNADGDIAEYARRVTLTPGATSREWLYAPIPHTPQFRGDEVWLLRVYTETEDGDRDEEVGVSRISYNLLFSQGIARLEEADGHDVSLIAIIGRSSRMGLDGYAVTGTRLVSRPPSAHEATRTVNIAEPANVPDKPQGLTALEAIVWSSNADPNKLPADSADAIRAYVERGGHLIIALPADGDPFNLRRPPRERTRFGDLLPAAPRKDEDVPISDLLPIVSRSETAPGQRGVSVRVFKDLDGDFDAISAEGFYEPLLTLPDGRVLVVQRRYGHGRVTVLGVDPAQLVGFGLPHADVFWNRILGRRADTPSASDLNAAQNAKHFRNQDANENSLMKGNLFRRNIRLEGTTGAALLLGVVLFIIYWLVGVGSFFVLKSRDKQHHAWLVFAIAAGVFTAVTWGSVGVIRKTNTEIKHVTILDYIAQPPGAASATPSLYRARSWITAYLPKYGAARVSIESYEDQQDSLIPWAAPGVDVSPFPNPDRFQIDVGRGMADYEVPSRATAGQYYADYLGTLKEEWSGIFRIDRPLREVNGKLQGRVQLVTPGDLKHVLIIHIENARNTPTRYARDKDGEKKWVRASGMTLNRGWTVSTDMFSGDIYDLGQIMQKSTRLQGGFKKDFFDEYTKGGGGLSSDPDRDDDVRNYMQILSFFNQMEQPPYLEPGTATRTRQPNDAPTAVFRRWLGRDLDLSTWFTRPCVIIIGFIENAPCPVPLRIDGDSPDANDGLIMVRWIYPLPLIEAETKAPLPDPEEE